MDSSVVVLYRKRETCPIYPKLNHAFQILGIEPRLVLSDEALRDLFREAGKQVHPDAGGGEGEFAALRDAYATLASPSRRLMRWLELRCSLFSLASATRAAKRGTWVEPSLAIGLFAIQIHCTDC